MKTRRLRFFSVLMVALLLGGYGVWVRQANRQYALNQQLIAAIRACDPRKVVALLEMGANPNTPVEPAEMPTFFTLLRNLLTRAPCSNGPTALMISAEPLLIKEDENKFKSFEDLDTPHPEYLAIMEALLKYGADVHYRDLSGNTALNYAAAWKDNREINLLLVYGAARDNSNNIGETPLMEAAADMNVEGVRTLLNHHANVNHQSNSGYTALIYAAQSATPAAVDMVNDLLAHHADFRLEDQQGWTALTFAKFARANEIVNKLREAEAQGWHQNQAGGL